MAYKEEHLTPRGGGGGGFSAAILLCLVCPMGLGSDKSCGGAHGVLRTVVDIVLLLPVDPVGPWALPVQRGRCKRGTRAHVTGVSGLFNYKQI